MEHIMNKMTEVLESWERSQVKNMARHEAEGSGRFHITKGFMNHTKEV